MTTRRGGGLLQQVARPTNGRIVAGVCAGLAETLNIDVTLVRLGFLVLLLAKGVGVLLYVALWLLMPADRPARPDETVVDIVHENLRGMGGEIGQIGQSLRDGWVRTSAGGWPRPLSRRWIALVLIAVGVVILLYSLGLFGWLGVGRVFGLLAIIAGAAVLISR